MSKFPLLIATASLAGLDSCAPPPPPPLPRFQTYSEFSPVPPPSTDERAAVAPPPSPALPPSVTGGYPTAKRTANPDQVISPYDPFNVIDVAGFSSGQLVRDPSNQQIFRVP